MEAKLKKELGTSMLKFTGHSGGGCISEAQSYDTDSGRVFVKINHKSEVSANVYLLRMQLAVICFGAILAVESLFFSMLPRPS